MSSVLVPIVYPGRTGAQLPSQVAGTADMYVANNDGLLLVEVANPTGGPLNVTFVATATFGDTTAASKTISVPAGETLWLGPWPPATYNSATGTLGIQAATGLLLRGLGI
jgi:hypothetical protein